MGSTRVGYISHLSDDKVCSFIGGFTKVGHVGTGEIEDGKGNLYDILVSRRTGKTRYG